MPAPGGRDDQFLGLLQAQNRRCSVISQTSQILLFSPYLCLLLYLSYFYPTTPSPHPGSPKPHHICNIHVYSVIINIIITMYTIQESLINVSSHETLHNISSSEFFPTNKCKAFDVGRQNIDVGRHNEEEKILWFISLHKRCIIRI